MALIACPECGKEISDKAKSCPGCGYDNSNISFQKMIIIACPECGKKISDKAESCSSCGYDNKENTVDTNCPQCLKETRHRYITDPELGKDTRQCIVCGTKVNKFYVYKTQDGRKINGLWASCWQETEQYFDFTTPEWGQVGHQYQTDSAKAYQIWYAKHRGMALEKVNKNIETVLIPPGKFLMGKQNEQRLVLVKRPFYMGKYPVTQRQWLNVIGGKNPALYKNYGYLNDLDLPVERVKYEGCIKFCAAIGARLPKEAEWEYACRAGTLADRYGDLAKIAWYRGNAGNSPHPVGEKLPNSWGLYDMLGNVDECCSDLLSNGNCVVRGGSFETDEGWFIRSLCAFCRNEQDPESAWTFTTFGFRCVFDVL